MEFDTLILHVSVHSGAKLKYQIPYQSENFKTTQSNSVEFAYPKTIQNDLKIARKCFENCTYSDGPVASDCFEIFGLIWNLIL